MSEHKFEPVPYEQAITQSQASQNLQNGANPPLFTALSAEQRSRLILHLSRKTRKQQVSDQIHSLLRDRELDHPPLPFAQQRLWLLDQLRPHNPFYNISIAVHLKGPLCIHALEMSLNAIIRRHEILRTTFLWGDDQPYQHIAAILSVGIRVVDLQFLPLTAQNDHAKRLAINESRVPFDLTRGPLLRMLVLRLGPETHLMVLVLHHIISDNWSNSLIIKELNAYYHAFTTDQPANLPALTVQYTDFAYWQQQWLQNGIIKQQLDYWTHKLAGAPTSLSLPIDHAWPLVQSYRGKTLFFSLSPALSEALWRISQQEGTTLFMTLLATFAISLSKFSGQQDLLIGVPIANRTRKEWEDLVGFFANTLVMRINLTGQICYRDALAHTRAVALEAYTYQDLPFEQLVRALLVNTDKRRNPLVQVFFSFQSVPVSVKNLLGLQGEELVYDNETAKFDLTLNMKKAGQQLSGKLNYNTDIFEAPTITRLLQDFLALLEVVARDPGQKIAR